MPYRINLKTIGSWLGFVMLAICAFALADGHQAMAATHGPSPNHLLLFGIAGIVNIRNLFTREAIIRYLEVLGPAYPSVVLDTIFTNRPQQPGPLIGSDIVRQMIKAICLSRRGAPAISIGGSTGQTEFYEPLPIKPKIGINGVDLNNLRLFSQDPNSTRLLEAWAQTKTDVLRRTVRATTEALCASALTGKISYPVQMEGGGYELFEIDYGAPQSLQAGSYKYLDDPDLTLADLVQMFVGIRKTFQRTGIGGKVVHWAGEDAFMKLFDVVSRLYTSARVDAGAGIGVELGENYVMIGTIKVELRAEEYTNPRTGAFTPIIDPGTIKSIALDAGHVMPYASLDDLDSNLQPMPLFIKPIKLPDGSGYDLQGESKPLPVVNSLGICDTEAFG